MTGWTLEDEIEFAWERLTRLGCHPRTGLYPVRRYFLDDAGRLMHGTEAERAQGRLHEVGYYTGQVTRENFRADVFYVHNLAHGGLHARK
jgi:hypothetical protein